MAKRTKNGGDGCGCVSSAIGIGFVVVIVNWIKENIEAIAGLFYVLIGAVVIYALVRIIDSVVFKMTHKRPLSDEEVELLSKARRNAYINELFAFSHQPKPINPEYRSSLNREGRWDKIDIELKHTLAILTELLKYKRHEWSVWCLANDSRCIYLWANKGWDNSSCYFKGSMHQLIDLANATGCTTLIHMHNHPHTADRTWNLLSPSDTDLQTFSGMKDTCNEAGLNFVDALCSQGKYIIYGFSFYEGYYPAGTRVEDIAAENGIDEKSNYILHKELRKIKNTKIKPLK